MDAFDPLVTVPPRAPADRRGWTLAAAIVARLQEAGLAGEIDAPTILGPALSELSEAEREELAQEMAGPLADTTGCFLAAPPGRARRPLAPPPREA
jgi:hypothetical protein